MANLLSTSVSGSLSSTGRISTTYNTDRYQFNLSRSSGSNWWFTNDSDKLGLHLNNVGDRIYFATDGNIWSSYYNDWLSNIFNSKQNASTAITTSNIGSQSVASASQVSGVSVSAAQAQALKNTLDSPTLPYKCDIYVEGEGDKFYPVHFMFGDQDIWRRIIIRRGYGEEAPWDPIGTGVHHGGLLLDWEGNFGGWGGAEYSDRLRVFNESYTNVCADMYIYTHSMGYVFMLRGGHALYHIFSDQPIRGYYQEGTPDIAYNTNTLFYDDTWSGNNTYDVYAPRPLGLSEVNSSRIDGLRTKKQSLFDGRYQPLENQRLSTGNSPSFSSVYANDVYTTGGWFRNHTNNSGIYWSNTGWHLMPENNADFRFHSGSNSDSAIRMETNGTTRGYVYANSSNEIGFLNNGRSWRLRVYPGGAVESYGDFRAPIFYDSTDTGYYLDPNGTSNLLKFSERTMGFNGMNPMSASSPYESRFNASAGYRNGTMGYGNTDFNTIARNWGSGFIDTWSSPANAPGGSTHYTGLQGVHYSDGGSSFYGFQMACAGEADNRFFWRSSWPSMRSWVEMIHSGNIASQSVSYADESGFASSAGSVEWTSVQNKPATFPPSSHTHDDRYLVKGGSWYGSGLPGSRWGGFSTSGGEIVFGDGLPNAGQMGILIDGAYLAGENNGFWSLASDNSWGSRRGMYWDGSNLNFTTNSPVALFSDVRAPIFYDSADTYYYVDPNSTSRLNRVGSFYVHNNYTVDADHTYGIYFDNTLPSSYGIFREGGAWTWPYPDLRIAFHTGIKLGANASYEGIRFYTDYDMSTQVMSVNNGSDPLGGGNVYVNNSLQAGSSLRAPIFYDSQDTGYYVDPNSTSRLNAINYDNLYFAGDTSYGFIGRNVYADTVNGRGSDPLELNYYDGGPVKIGSGTYGSKDLYASMVYVNSGNAVIHAGNIGSQNVNASNYQYATGSSSDAIASFRQTPAHATSFREISSSGPGGTWWMIQNFRHSNSSNYWGTQVAWGWEDNALRLMQRNVSADSWSGWVEYLNTNNAAYAWNMNQYVRTSDAVTFASTTTQTFLIASHSDNTKGYRIYNTSNSSVSAMFVNSSNQLVIAAGAVDQINLNKKVYVNGVALGVNVAPSATAGRIDASNDIVAYSTSDERFKENIAPISNALDKVKALTGVEFDWRKETKDYHGYVGHDVGVIAQQVKAVLPEAVRTNANGYLAVRYEKLIGLLIEANKELAARVEELEKKLN